MPPKNARILPFLTNLTVCFFCAIITRIVRMNTLVWGVRSEMFEKHFFRGFPQPLIYLFP